MVTVVRQPHERNDREFGVFFCYVPFFSPQIEPFPFRFYFSSVIEKNSEYSLREEKEGGGARGVGGCEV